MRTPEEPSTHRQEPQLLHGHAQIRRPLPTCARPLASEAASDGDESPGSQEAFLSFSHAVTCLQWVETSDAAKHRTGCPPAPGKECSGPKWQEGQVRKPRLTQHPRRHHRWLPRGSPAMPGSVFLQGPHGCWFLCPERSSPVPGSRSGRPQPQDSPSLQQLLLLLPIPLAVRGSPLISAIIPSDPLCPWPVSSLETWISTVSFIAVTWAPSPVPGSQLSVSLSTSGVKKRG